MLATTATRSEGDPATHRQFEREAEDRVEWYAARPHLIEDRLGELDEEWDIERAIQANAATLALVGTVLAMRHDERWAYLPLIVTGFLLQHATQGWCPPVPILRAFGFRTLGEIDRERYALKAIRGDFDSLPPDTAPARHRASAAFDAAH
ncbi:hypothetical protein [uncultured Paracoccus sp.]|uniref:hypothetical protein n=1 Tax=uncultured Paracoccus sp. TaxID=189685 RepID=UPI00260BCB94|nr:hypothetical protein [uncultured Paracoccus sp.]